MNDIVFKIYVDLFMLDTNKETILLENIIQNNFPLYYSKKEAEKKIEELIKNRGEVLNEEEIRGDNLYLRFSIYREIDNIKEIELESEINRTIYAKFIEICSVEKLKCELSI